MAMKKKKLLMKMNGQDPSAATEAPNDLGATNPPIPEERDFVGMVTGTVEDHKMKFHENDDFIYP